MEDRLSLVEGRIETLKAMITTRDNLIANLAERITLLESRHSPHEDDSGVIDNSQPERLGTIRSYRCGNCGLSLSGRTVCTRCGQEHREDHDREMHVIPRDLSSSDPLAQMG